MTGSGGPSPALPSVTLQGSCSYHPGRFIHDDARCICAGSVRRDRPKIDAEMAQLLKKSLIKGNGKLSSSLSIHVRRGLVCNFKYTCCGAVDARAPGCVTTRHTSKSKNG